MSAPYLVSVNKFKLCGLTIPHVAAGTRSLAPMEVSPTAHRTSITHSPTPPSPPLSDSDTAINNTQDLTPSPVASSPVQHIFIPEVDSHPTPIGGQGEDDVDFEDILKVNNNCGMEISDIFYIFFRASHLPMHWIPMMRKHHSWPSLMLSKPVISSGLRRSLQSVATDRC